MPAGRGAHLSLRLEGGGFGTVRASGPQDQGNGRTPRRLCTGQRGLEVKAQDLRGIRASKA